MPAKFDNWFPFQRDYLLDRAQFRQVVKFRQGGFTETISYEGVKEAAAESFPDEFIIYISAGQRQAGLILERCKWWITAPPPIGLGLERSSLIVDSNSRIQLPNGSNIVSLPSNPETIRGYPGRRIYLDEFAHNSQADKVYQAIAPSLSRKDVKRYLTMISSAFGKRGKFYDIYRNSESFSKHVITIEDAIRCGYPIDIKECRELAGDDIAFRQEYMCEFLDDSMTYFPFDLILSRINYELTNATSEELKAEGGHYGAGYDPAKMVDSGVFTVLEKKGEKKILRHITEWRLTPYHLQEKFIEAFMKNAKVSTLMTDQTGIGQKIQEDLERRLPGRAQGITFSADTKERMITNLKSEFDAGNIEIPDNIKLKNQLHSIDRELTKTGVIRYNAMSGEHDDYVWSLAMANECFAKAPIYRPMIATAGGIRV